MNINNILSYLKKEQFNLEMQAVDTASEVQIIPT